MGDFLSRIARVVGFLCSLNMSSSPPPPAGCTRAPHAPAPQIRRWMTRSFLCYRPQHERLLRYPGKAALRYAGEL